MSVLGLGGDRHSVSILVHLWLSLQQGSGTNHWVNVPESFPGLPFCPFSARIRPEGAVTGLHDLFILFCLFGALPDSSLACQPASKLKAWLLSSPPPPSGLSMPGKATALPPTPLGDLSRKASHCAWLLVRERGVSFSEILFTETFLQPAPLGATTEWCLCVRSCLAHPRSRVF